MHRRTATLTLALLATLPVGCKSQPQVAYDPETGQQIEQPANRRSLLRVAERGDYYMDIKQWEKACVEWAEYVQRKPDSPEGRFKYGTSLLNVNRPQEAREQFRILTDMDPLNATYADGLAESYYRAGEYEQLQALLTRRTENGTAADFIRAGTYYQKSGKPDEALEAFKVAAKLDQGRSPRAYLAMADLFASVGDKKKELESLRRAAYLDPSNQVVSQRIRAAGGVPGPTVGLKPDEFVPPPPPAQGPGQ